MQPADRSWTRPATEAGKWDHPANSLEREPPLKPQFEQAKASTKPLEPPQPDPAKVRADQRQARRTQNFEGSRLAKAPVVTNAFERVNDNLRQPVRPRPAPERPVARDNGLREAFKQVQAKPAPQRTPERNWARGLNRPSQPQATPQPKPEPAREQAVKPEFNRASQAEAERGQAREQSGSQMVRESQPKHLMQPPPEMRREPDRKDHNDRLAQERTREAARQASREAEQRERDGRQGPEPPGSERGR